MPTYEYVCTACRAPLEVVQSIHDPALTECPACDDGRLRKVFGNVGVVFKGSGFYRTDSRRAKGSSTGASSAGSGEKPSEGGASTTPAKAPADSKATASPSAPSSSAASSAGPAA